MEQAKFQFGAAISNFGADAKICFYTVKRVKAFTNKPLKLPIFISKGK